ncbi:hypothetical protein C0J52_14190 [Blattella germanica]|nr:hypothetical protein C0J52_14190 [Blattella germanica]
MYAAAGGLSLARRQARRQQRQQAAESRPPLRAPATPLPPIRHQFHPQPPQDEELLQMSRDVQAQLLDPAAHNYPELNGLSPEVGLFRAIVDLTLNSGRFGMGHKFRWSISLTLVTCKQFTVDPNGHGIR